MPSIFIYVRPWNRDQFKDLAKNTWPDCDVITLSEHRSVDEDGLSEAFYRILPTCQANTLPEGLSEADVAEVIQRCRFLRAIKSDRARRYVCAMNIAVEQFFKTHRPLAALSLIVDSYVIHLIYLACLRHDIPFVGLVPTFVNGYFRVTGLGERIWNRMVTDDEVNRVCESLLCAEYKPSFLAPNSTAVRKKALLGWLRNLPKPLWFRARRWLSGDVLNYHYYASQIIAQQYWSMWPQRYDGIRPTRRSDLTKGNSGKSVIFLPLQMSPEATIDYWSKDRSWIDYEMRVITLLDKHIDKHIFVVKEHPNVLGSRTAGFYRSLSERKNCVLVAADISSNELLGLSDAVVICTGTVGFEAALRGVPVFSDSSPFHLNSDRVRPLAELTQFIAAPSGHEKVTREAAADMVRYLLEGLLPGRFINDGTWQPKNIEHVEFNKSISRALIRCYTHK